MNKKLLVLLALPLLLTGCSSNEKSLKDYENPLENNDMTQNEEIDCYITYGINLYFVCNLSKHPEYLNWVEDFPNSQEFNEIGAKDHSPEEELFYLNRYISQTFINSIIEDFPNSTGSNFYVSELDSTQIIVLAYSARKNQNESLDESKQNFEDYKEQFYLFPDYNKANELLEKEYIDDLIVHDVWTKLCLC